MRRRYLIVDDNPAFAENLAEILEDAGAEAVFCFRGADAVRHLSGPSFDALITDMRMPEMGGAAVVRQVRALDPGLPAIVITANTQSVELDAARREGVMAVLPKPVPVPVLLDLLAAARRDGVVVVVAEDIADSANLAELLGEHGFAALIAESVVATERLGPRRPFAAIVDLRVPGGTNGEALQRLTARFPGLPVLMFRKPFDSAALLHELDRLHQQRCWQD